MGSRYSEYRQIRESRTYRTLGRMSWWRIVIGLLLLLLVLLISGVPSKKLAESGHYKTAERLMISPAWMEKYKPDLKAMIDAGSLYADGDFDGAADRLRKENVDPEMLPEELRVLLAQKDQA